MRAAKDDLMQSFRFHATAMDEVGANPLEFTGRGDGFEGGGQAGFQSITLPEVSVEATEYREGTFVWTQKYPGPPTVSECTLMRGVAKGDMTFYDWVMAGVNGKAYRATVTIWHYQRAEMGLAEQSSTQDSIRRVECYEAFAMRAKPGGDLDSASGEVSLAEVDFACEWFVLKAGA